MGEFIALSILMIILGVGCERNKSYDRLYLLVFCTLFCVMGALRGHSIGNDTQAYIRLFSSVNELPFSLNMALGRFEKGYLLLNKLLSYISFNPQIILIFSSIITYLGIYLFIKKESKHYWISMILFLVNGYFRFSMSAIRQMIAISLLLLGYYVLNQKKYIRYIIITILAFTIHSSAIVPAIIIFVATFRWKNFYYRIGIVASVALLFLQSFFTRIVGGFFNYSRYLGSIYDDGINVASIFLALMCFTCLMVIYFSDKEHANENIFFKIEFIRFCFFIIAFRLNSIDRMADYFLIFEVVGVTNALSRYKNQRTRQILTLGLFVFYILYSYIWGVMRPSLQMVWPYKTFWM